MLEPQRGDKRSAAIFIGATAIQIGNGFFIVHVVAGRDAGFMLAVGAINSHGGLVRDSESYYRLPDCLLSILT